MTTFQRGFDVEMINTRWTRDITNRCIYITVHEISFTLPQNSFQNVNKNSTQQVF